MDETRKAWDEVGDGFTKLGRMISERYKSQSGDEPARPGGAEENVVADAVRRATEELDKAFTSLGDDGFATYGDLFDRSSDAMSYSAGPSSNIRSATASLPPGSPKRGWW